MSTALWQGTLATAAFISIALILGLPVLLGHAALGPDSMLDSDPLYGSTRPLSAPLPTMSDPTPIALDWPRDLAIAQGLRRGRFDLWNPLAACGTPLWAELGGPFFPLKVPFYLFPSRITYELFLLLRLPFAALGAYLLGRRRGLTVVGATAAAVSFELCSFLISQVRFGVYSNTFVLPWALLGAEMVTREPSARTAVGAAVLLALAASAGHAGIALLVVAAFALASFMHVVALRRTPRTAVRCLFWSAASAVLAVGLAAPTLLPTAELLTIAASYKNEAIGQSVRATVLSGWQVALPLLLFLPGFADGMSVLGVLPATAAAIGVVGGGLDPALVAVALLGLLIGATPIGLGWVNDLPPVRMILPVYALPLVALPLTQAAGRGVELLTALPVRRLGLAAVAPMATCVLLWLLCAPLRGLRMTVGLLTTPHLWPRLALIPAATAGLTGVAVALRQTWLARWVAPVLTIMMVCERVVAGAPELRQPTSKVLASAPSSAVRFLQQSLANGTGRMVGVPHRVGYPVTPMLFGLADVRGFAALPLRRYADYLRAVDVLSPPQAAPPPSDLAMSMVVQHVREAHSPLLDLAAVRWIAVPRRGPAPAERLLDDDPQVRLAFEDGPVLVYENRAALPRVHIAHHATPVADEDAARAWALRIGALRGHADDLELRDTVVIEPDEHGTFPLVEPTRPSSRDETWIIEQDDPDRLTIGARLESPGLLVIADTYAPGWRASVDGTPASIHPANLMFRAVSLEAGEHVVELRYRPRGFFAGTALFAGSAIICALLLAYPRNARPEP